MNSDTDRLLNLVRKRISDFQGGKLGNQFSFEEFHFELVFARRNTVYRVRGANTWYVKIPSWGGSKKALREKSGAEVMRAVSQDVESCFSSFYVSVCPDQGIIVSTAVPGEPLHTQLYLSLLTLCIRQKHSILDAYRKLGTVLAALHGSVASNTQPTTHSTAMDEFAAVVNYLPDTSEDRYLREFLSAREISTTELGFIHGNLRRENIILTPDQRIGMIDFEDAGLGSRYDDLSQICSDMLLTKTAKIFPWRPVYRALNAMLSSYNQHTLICEKTLLKYTAIRVATKRALLFTEKCQTIAKIPVSRHKTHQLLHALLSAFERNSLAHVDRRLNIQSVITN